MSPSALDILPLCATGCLAALYAVRWRDYRLPQLTARSQTDSTEALPRLSIVVPAHDQAEQLMQNLPALLEQDYPDFEVIVVDEASTDGTAALLEHMESGQPRLRHTFVPASARHIDRTKLALTLGIRAAHSDWCVLTRPDCRPASRRWLRLLAARLRPVTLGYANYADNGSLLARRAIYDRLMRHLAVLRSARRGRATGGDGCNMVVQKSLFLSSGGFGSQLTLPFGEDELLVDNLSTRHNVAFVLHPDAAVRQTLPPRFAIAAERLCQAETARHGSLRHRLQRFRKGAGSLLARAYIYIVVAYIALRTAETLRAGTYTAGHAWADIAMAATAVLATAVPLILLRRCTRQLGERPFGLTHTVFTLTQPYRAAAVKLRRFRHRREFVRPPL